MPVPFTPLDDAAIAGLVDAFYAKVRRHPELGPVFAAAVHDWEAHSRLLVSFWSSVMLGTRSYRGNPMAVHRGVAGLHAGLFAPWLALWRETAEECLDAEAATQIVAHAERIGASLRIGLGMERTQEFGLRIVSLSSGQGPDSG
jgi:hemoglobin